MKLINKHLQEHEAEGNLIESLILPNAECSYSTRGNVIVEKMQILEMRLFIWRHKVWVTSPRRLRVGAAQICVNYGRNKLLPLLSKQTRWVSVTVIWGHQEEGSSPPPADGGAAGRCVRVRRGVCMWAFVFALRLAAAVQQCMVNNRSELIWLGLIRCIWDG